MQEVFEFKFPKWKLLKLKGEIPQFLQPSEIKLMDKHRFTPADSLDAVTHILVNVLNLDAEMCFCATDAHDLYRCWVSLVKLTWFSF